MADMYQRFKDKEAASIKAIKFPKIFAEKVSISLACRSRQFPSQPTSATFSPALRSYHRGVKSRS